jgi:hypothetical protein
VTLTQKDHNNPGDDAVTNDAAGDMSVFCIANLPGDEEQVVDGADC